MAVRPSESGWSRRQVVGATALLALAVGVPAATIKFKTRDGEAAPTARDRKLLHEVSQLVIPRTATAGAGDVGVGDFVIKALSVGLAGSRAPVASASLPQVARFVRRDGSLRHVAWLTDELDGRAHGDFLAQAPAARGAILARLDREAYAPGAPDSPWKSIKALILTGYYTSEVGGSKELRYELVPGRYDRDVPLHPGDRAWSSDWTAVDFG